MAYQPTRDTGEYSSKGGGQGMIHEVQDTGAELSSPDGFWDLGLLDNTTFSDNTDYTPQYDEKGDQYANEEQNRVVTLKGTLTQRSANILGIAKNVRGKYYIIKHDRGIVNGKYQELFMFGQIRPGFEVPLPGGKWEIQINGIKNASAITLSTAHLAGTGTAGWTAHASTTQTIAAVTASGSDGYYVITETATA